VEEAGHCGKNCTLSKKLFQNAKGRNGEKVTRIVKIAGIAKKSKLQT